MVAHMLTSEREACLTIAPKARSVLDMRPKVVDNACYLCFIEDAGPYEYHAMLHSGPARVKAYRCVDKKGCTARQAANNRVEVEDKLADLRALSESLAAARADVKRLEAEIATKVRTTLTGGGGATEIGRAAGISRERVYQLRDGRR